MQSYKRTKTIVRTTFFPSWFSHCLEIKRNSTNLMRMWSRFDFFFVSFHWIVFFFIFIERSTVLSHKKPVLGVWLSKKIECLFYKKKMKKNKLIKCEFYLYHLCFIASNVRIFMLSFAKCVQFRLLKATTIQNCVWET